MKFIAFLTFLAAAAAGVGYAANPEQFNEYLAWVAQAAFHVWDKIEANPIPVVIALGTFLLTVIYLQLKGKTLRESVALAATRVRLVPVDGKETEDENPVVRRAKARATWAQLMSDQVTIQNRQKHLPEALRTAEKETCYTEQALTDAAKALAGKEKAHDVAVAKLEALRKEKATGDAELAAIEVELKKLSNLI